MPTVSGVATDKPKKQIQEIRMEGPYVFLLIVVRLIIVTRVFLVPAHRRSLPLARA